MSETETPDPLNESACEHLIDGHGVCSRRQEHPIHLPLGLSALEHKFKRSTLNDEKKVFEVAVLTKRNLKEVAERSGKSVHDLQLIREMTRIKGKKPKVRYELQPGHEPRTIGNIITDNALDNLGD
jgi:hypothetical protein